MKDLVVALTDVPSGLDPYESNTLHIHTVMWPIYEPLFDIGDDMGLYPCLAEDWSTADGLTYAFQLRTGAKFHGGTPLTASSVVASLQEVTSRASFRGRILSDLIDLGGTKPLCDHTVQIQLKYPKPELLFLALMTNREREGTGPFYLDQSQHSFVLAKNPNYRPLPAKLDRIVFKDFSAAPAQVVKELLAGGQVHFARDIDPESALGVLDKPQLQTRRVRPFGLHYLGFHLGSDLFKQPDVRRAFREAIDFQEIQSETGLEPAKGPIPAGVEAYDSSLPTPGRGDTGKALKHTCGATIGNIEIPLLFNVNSYYGKELAERIEHDVTPSGLKIKRDPKGTSSDLLKEIEQRRKKPDPYVFIYNWYSILPAAELFLRPLFEGKRFANEERMPDNLTGYAEAPFDDLLAAARKPGISLQDRIKHYQEAQKKVVDDVPAIFLGHSRVRYSVHSTKVRGLKLNVQSFPVDRYVGVDVL